MNHFISEVPVFERISRFSRVFLKKTAVSLWTAVNEKTRVSWRKNARLFIYYSSFNGKQDFTPVKRQPLERKPRNLLTRSHSAENRE